MPQAEATEAPVVAAESVEPTTANGAESALGAPSVVASVGSFDGAGEVIIQTENLRKVYRPPFSREGKTALHGLTIDVLRGEIFGLVGPNGSGKTTTLKLL